MKWIGFRRARFDKPVLATFLQAGGWRVRGWGFYIGNSGLFFLWRDKDPEAHEDNSAQGEKP